MTDGNVSAGSLPQPAVSAEQSWRQSPEAVLEGLRAHGYLADEGLATVVYLAVTLRRPLLLEGEAGVGKTEVAKVLSALSQTELLRLQCYEGIDASQSLYEWDYARQLLHLRAAEAGGTEAARNAEADLYAPRFLVRRPLLQAIDHGEGPAPVLLIDEVDRADDEFEAFLLEVLSDYSVTIPELGKIEATQPPLVILTSNRTRDVHDALKRRCLYHWVEHPGFEREVEIVRTKAQVPEQLAMQIAAAVEQMRSMDLYKPPGVAESIDWARSVASLGRSQIDERTIKVTLGAVLKYREDADRVQQSGIAQLMHAAVTRSAG